MKKDAGTGKPSFSLHQLRNIQAAHLAAQPLEKFRSGGKYGRNQDRLPDRENIGGARLVPGNVDDTKSAKDGAH